MPSGGGFARDFERGSVSFVDFFLVHDGRLDVGEVVGQDGAIAALWVRPRDRDRDDECAPADVALPNPIARPELAVSRIDAAGVAPAEDGSPDPAFEARLLADFFDRNHDYRTGRLRVAARPACLSHGLPSDYEALLREGRFPNEARNARLDLHRRVTVARALAWLAEPALVRSIRAHSDRLGSALQGGRLDARVLRAAFREGLIGGGATFFVHVGCEAISPPGAGRLPFDDPAFGWDNGAQALLFFAGGLALVGRAKVFYDSPPGFVATLAAGGTVGEAWRRTFEIEAGARDVTEVGGDIGRKRTYFWSLLGDATLRFVPSRPGGSPASAED